MTGRQCVTSGCAQPRLGGYGLCEVHYRQAIQRPHEREAVWCQCERPIWATCGPWFAGVRMCRVCGSPDREQLGRWPT